MRAVSLPRSVVPSRTPSPSPSPLHGIDNNNTFIRSCASLSNKYLPSTGLDTPPSSPPSKVFPTLQKKSPLYPPNIYKKRIIGSSEVYEIDATDLVAALDHLSTQSLPDTSQLFPWLHGLNPQNYFQTAVLTKNQHDLTRTPSCFRGVTLVKADGNLSSSSIKGAIAPGEFLTRVRGMANFRDVDPKVGFSVRNFHIQVTKIAMISDIVVFGDNQNQALELAGDIAAAQRSLREEHIAKGLEFLPYNSFLCTSSFKAFEELYPSLVVTDSRGSPMNNILTLSSQEKAEINIMTKASEIDKNVWLGPTPRYLDEPDPGGSGCCHRFDIYIECVGYVHLDSERLPNFNSEHAASYPASFKFSSFGSVMSATESEVDGIFEACEFIYKHSHGILTTPTHKHDSYHGPRNLVEGREKKVLIHCKDGYTESSFLGLSYFIFATKLPFSSALIDLHVAKERNFFLPPTDFNLLNTLSPTLIAESPARREKSPCDNINLTGQDPKWIENMDSFLPSRITKYMYLGNVSHANNPQLLSQLGIRQILSIGEIISWGDKLMQEWGRENLMFIQGIEDNGIDPLLGRIEECLGFIAQGKLHNTSTLVHCRMGVSRSASICIAEVMRSLNLSFPRAYSFVRARRLNIIIQPHLRFVYELLKWEERLHDGETYKREMEWAEISKQISAINRPFSS
ncbi:hypothetical protein K3495_g5380 [Podosphaera aphanis]|nr:hypothetical protein K3495_g5380 [Podosphaera aphanis]